MSFNLSNLLTTVISGVFVAPEVVLKVIEIQSPECLAVVGFENIHVEAWVKIKRKRDDLSRYSAWGLAHYSMQELDRTRLEAELYENSCPHCHRPYHWQHDMIRRAVESLYW